MIANQWMILAMLLGFCIIKQPYLQLKAIILSRLLMQDQNPQSQLIQSKKQTIEEYINQNLQLKTLRIKKFSFQNTLSNEVKSSRKLRSSNTTRQALNITHQRYTQDSSLWEPKLSHRKLTKDPKVLLSVQRRKIKTSQNIRKANQIFSNPKSRQGFKGEKIRTHSFFIEKSQEKTPKKLIIETKKSVSLKKYKYVPNFPFNLNYLKNERKKQQKQNSIEDKKIIGSNKGYIAFFASQNFTKYLQKNIVPSSYQQSNKANERLNKAKKKNQ